MKTILHIAANYPDVFPNKISTAAVKNLIHLSTNFNHMVVSITKTSSVFNEKVIIEKNMISIRYFTVSFGIGHKFFMWRLAKTIYSILKHDPRAFSLIHAHKLTVDGIVGYFLSQWMHIPLVCSVRGDTDLKLIRWKLLSRTFFRKIFNKSCAVFFIAPWSQQPLQHYLKIPTNSKAVFLPNCVKECQIRYPLDEHNSRFVSIFNLDQFKRKGFLPLLKALHALRHENYSFQLDIIGEGKSLTKLQQLVHTYGLSNNIHFLGAMKNDEVIHNIGKYSALLMPSIIETFGMVYLEALLSGTPILYSQNVGIDGYFKDLEIGVKVEPTNTESVKAGVRDMLINSGRYKKSLLEALQAGRLNFFRKERIQEKYETILSQYAL